MGKPVVAGRTPPKVRRGAITVLTVLIAIVAIDALIVARQVVEHGLTGTAPSFIRVGLTLLLMLAVWRGLRWARVLTVAMLLAASCLLIQRSLSDPQPLLIMLGVGFGLCSILLTFPADVRIFFDHQRQKRSRGR